MVILYIALTAKQWELMLFGALNNKPSAFGACQFNHKPVRAGELFSQTACCVNAALAQPSELEAADKRSRVLYGLTTSNSRIPLGEDLKEAVQLICVLTRTERSSKM